MRLLITSLFFLFFLSVESFCQDILITTDDKFSLVKILEVSSENVKYKKHNNLDGPVYLIKTSDIYSIEYENGELELYNDMIQVDTQTQEEGQGDFTFKSRTNERESINPTNHFDINDDCVDDNKMGAYAELGGTSLIGTTVNFDYTFINKTGFKFGARGGLGFSLSVDGDLGLTNPVSAFVLVGSGSNFYEGGLGFLNYDITNIHIHTYHGYRFQPKCKSYFIRANLAFLYSIYYGRPYLFPGVSYGTRF